MFVKRVHPLTGSHTVPVPEKVKCGEGYAAIQMVETRTGGRRHYVLARVGPDGEITEPVTVRTVEGHEALAAFPDDIVIWLAAPISPPFTIEEISVTIWALLSENPVVVKKKEAVINTVAEETASWYAALTNILLGFPDYEDFVETSRMLGLDAEECYPVLPAVIETVDRDGWVRMLAYYPFYGIIGVTDSRAKAMKIIDALLNVAWALRTGDISAIAVNPED